MIITSRETLRELNGCLSIYFMHTLCLCPRVSGEGRGHCTNTNLITLITYGIYRLWIWNLRGVYNTRHTEHKNRNPIWFDANRDASFWDRMKFKKFGSDFGFIGHSDYPHVYTSTTNVIANTGHHINEGITKCSRKEMLTKCIRWVRFSFERACVHSSTWQWYYELYHSIAALK